MALNIHIAGRRIEAEKVFPVLSLETVEHELIFGELSACTKHNVPKLFNRLSDYYSDAVFSSEDIPYLLGELIELGNHLKSSEARQWVLKLAHVCRTAIDAGLSMYCFCD